MRSLLLAGLAAIAVTSAVWAQNNTTTTGNANSGDAYVSVPENNDLSSKVVGLDIYNNDDKDIGKIKDIALNPDGRTTAYIVSVGGFLGMGDHYVAVKPSAVSVTYNTSDQKWHAKMNATANQLKTAPEFKYTGRWNASKS
jgi:sporulation protein YlmC with PRC-barrel domain